MKTVSTVTSPLVICCKNYHSILCQAPFVTDTKRDALIQMTYIKNVFIANILSVSV